MAEDIGIDGITGEMNTVDQLEYFSSGEYEEDLEEGIEAILEKYGPFVVVAAQVRCPIRTGALPASISYTVEGTELHVTSNSPYYWQALPTIEAAYDFFEGPISAEIDMLAMGLMEGGTR